MEPYAAGWLSILPPIIAIVLALITKEVFSSLLIGIFSGAAIYTFGSGVPDPLIKMLDVTFSLMGQKVDFQNPRHFTQSQKNYSRHIFKTC